MAPKRKPAGPPRDAEGIFRGVSAFFVPHGVQSRRLEVAASPPFGPRPIRLPFVLRFFFIAAVALAGVEAEAGADGGPP